MYRNGFHSHTAPGMQITATANSSGIATGYLGPVPAGYCWYIERMTAHSNTAVLTGAVLEIFVLPDQKIASNYTATTGSRLGRQDVSLKPQNDISDSKSPIYVPEGYFVVAGWTGLASGDTASVSFQVAVHQLSMEYGMSRRDIRQVQDWQAVEDRERANSPGIHN